MSSRTWGVLALALVAQVGFSITEQGIPVLTGFIKTDLDVSAAVAGLVVACFPLGRIVGSYAAGVAADRLSSVGFGPDQPVASNDTEIGRAQNRRVEVAKQ